MKIIFPVVSHGFETKTLTVKKRNCKYMHSISKEYFDPRGMK
jgi:hypothetical protein